jgi:hypothetical protein
VDDLAPALGLLHAAVQEGRLVAGGCVTPDCRPRPGHGEVVVRQDQRVVQPELRAPLREARAEVGREQSGQGAVAGADLLAQLGRRAAVSGIGGRDRAQPLQPVIAGSGQVQRLLGRRPELVEQDSPQPRAFRAVVVRGTGVAGGFSSSLGRLSKA